MAEQDISSLIEEVEQRPFDRQFLSAQVLDVPTRDRTNSLPWRGQFTPDFVDALIRSNDSGEGLVLDPFAGSGTTLYSALRHGRNVVGNELNPAAVILSRTYELASLPPSERVEQLVQLRDDVRSLRSLSTDLTELDLATAADYVRETVGFQRMLLETAVLLAAKNGKHVNVAALNRSTKVISSLVASLPADSHTCHVLMGDARVLPLEGDSAGLVVTSPPYINVFNYHQNYRPAAEALGWQVLPVARAEIGSNRKHRQNRFLTVIQYGQDIAEVLEELKRVCRPGSRIVFVVGRESRVMNVAFNNSLLVSLIAELCGGLDFVRMQERKFVNRYGTNIYEDILTWNVTGAPGSSVTPVEAGRVVGLEMLQRGLLQSDEKTRPLIRMALDSASSVNPSPVPVFTQH